MGPEFIDLSADTCTLSKIGASIEREDVSDTSDVENVGASIDRKDVSDWSKVENVGLVGEGKEPLLRIAGIRAGEPGGL